MNPFYQLTSKFLIMQTLQIDGTKARTLYPTATKEFKTMLEDSFGKEYFSLKITDRVKTFEDACRELGIDPLQFSTTCAGDSADEIAYKQIKIIARALNEGWTPNWDNASEYKYYPWFHMRGGFSYANCDCWHQFSGVGSRLCFRTSELAEYAGKQFTAIYKAFMCL